MNLSLVPRDLAIYIEKQIYTLFPDGNKNRITSDYMAILDLAIQRLEYCFSKTNNCRYKNDKGVFYNHLYSDHNIVFLWFLANQIWKDTKDEHLCNKLYYLNKSLHGFDCNYKTKLPDVFLIIHGVGTMLGNAEYSDYFVCYHGVTIGVSNDNYPKIGLYNALTANTSLIGACVTGSNVTIGSGVRLINQKVSKNNIVFLDKENRIEFKETEKYYTKKYFNIDN
jgi:serine O-acetyltransferase